MAADMDTVSGLMRPHSSRGWLGLAVVIAATALVSIAEEGRALSSWAAVTSPAFVFSVLGHMAASAVAYLTGHAISRRGNA